MPLCDVRCIDTTPGSGGQFAPAAPVESYRDWLVERGSDPSFRMFFNMAANWGLGRAIYPPQEITGPYADQLKKMLAARRNQREEKRA